MKGSSNRSKERSRAAFPEVSLGKASEEYADSLGLYGDVGRKSKKVKKGGGFQSFGLSRNVLYGVLKMGYKVPTPIQRKTIPIALTGTDVVAMARTGSGKTAAFLVPMLEKLKAHSSSVGVRGIVLSPTRELALQTMKFAKNMAKLTDLRVCSLVGGDSMEAQFAALSNNPDIIVATPGRLMHHLHEVPDFSLGRVEMVVFDEGDRLFELGFAEQLRLILSKMPEHRQTCLFSATMPKMLVQFARAGLRDPQVIRLDVESKISENLRLAFFALRTEEKPAALTWLLREFIPQDQQAIVFCCTKHHVEFVYQLLNAAGVDCAAVYGSLDQVARVDNINKFRNKETRCLVVTDVAARGIDIPLLDNVINYDCADKPKLFIHRSGRVARAGRTGTAFTFVTSHELAYMVDLLLYLERDVTDKYEGGSKGYDLQSMRSEDVHFGIIPRSLLELELETVRSMIDNSPELQAALKSSTNAFKLYTKTRAEATKKGIAIGRNLSCKRVHPLFLRFVGEEYHEMTHYLTQLSKFRPQSVIMELDGPKAKRESALALMQAKRSQHQPAAPRHGSVARIVDSDDEQSNAVADDAPDNNYEQEELGHQEASQTEETSAAQPEKPRISAAARKKLKKAGKLVTAEAAALVSSEHKAKRADAEPEKSTHYLSMIPADADARRELAERQDRVEDGIDELRQLESHMLDIMPDDSLQIAQRKRILHWDARKKKYVQKTAREIAAMKQSKTKTESGAYVQIDEKKRGQLYEKWKAKTHKLISAEGEDEDEAAAELPQRAMKKRSTNALQDRNGRKIKQEVKTAETMRKDRLKTERAKARQRGQPKHSMSQAAAASKPFGKRGRPHTAGVSRSQGPQKRRRR